MRKVIFLDIDGVLNTSLWHSQANRGMLGDKYGSLFDSAAVVNLKKILDETGAEIVISSSWKFMGRSVLQEMWRDRGLPGEIVDVTPELLGNRGEEIKEWLMMHEKDVSHYAILDDVYDIFTRARTALRMDKPSSGDYRRKCEASNYDIEASETIDSNKLLRYEYDKSKKTSIF